MEEHVKDVFKPNEVLVSDAVDDGAWLGLVDRIEPVVQHAAELVMTCVHHKRPSGYGERLFDRRLLAIFSRISYAVDDASREKNSRYVFSERLKASTKAVICLIANQRMEEPRPTAIRIRTAK